MTVPVEFTFRANTSNAVSEQQKVVDGLRQITAAAKEVGSASQAAGRSIAEQAAANVQAAVRQKEALQGLIGEYAAIAKAARAGSAEQVAAADLAAVAQRKLGSSIVVTGQASGKASSEHEKHASALKGLDKEARGASSGLGILGGSLSRVAAYGSNTFLLGLLGGGLVKSIVDTTRSVQESEAQLSGSLQNIGAAAQTDQVDAYIKKLEQLSGFTETQLIPGMTRFLSVDKSVAKAEQDAGLATDVARKYHLQYSDAVRIVSLIEAGRLRGLQQYVGAIPPVTTAEDALKNKVAELTAEHIKADPAQRLYLEHQAKLADQAATAAEGMAALRDRVAGADQQFASTSAGHLAQFNVTMEKLQEDLGKVLIPEIDSLVQWLDKTVQHWDRSGNAARDMHTVVGLVKTGIGALGAVLPPIWNGLDTIAKAVGGWQTAFEIILSGLLAKKFFDLGQGIVNDFQKGQRAVESFIGWIQKIGPAQTAAAEETTAANTAMETSNAEAATSVEAITTAEGTIGPAAATAATEVGTADATIVAESTAAGTAAGAGFASGFMRGLGPLALILGSSFAGYEFFKNTFAGGSPSGTPDTTATMLGKGLNYDPRTGLITFQDTIVSVTQAAKMLGESVGTLKQQIDALNQQFAASVGGKTPPGVKGPVGAAAAGSPSAVAPTVVAYAEANKADSRGGHGVTPAQGFDCSGYIVAAYAAAGITLPHNAYQQWILGDGQPVPGGITVHVSPSDIQPGDAVYINNGLGGQQPGHVGMYVGGGQVLAYSEASGRPASSSPIGAFTSGGRALMGIRRWIKIKQQAGGAPPGLTGPPGGGTASGDQNLLTQIGGLTGTSTLKQKTASYSPLTPAQAATIIKAQIAVEQAQTDKEQLAAREKLLTVLKQELAAVKAEHETGKDRVKQLQAEKTLTGEIKSDRAAIAKLEKQPSLLLPAGLQQRLAGAEARTAATGPVTAGETTATLHAQLAARQQEITVIKQAITTLNQERVPASERVAKLKELKTLEDQLNATERQRAQIEKQLAQNAIANRERSRLGLGADGQPLAPGVSSLKKEYDQIIADTKRYGIELSAEQRRELQNFAWILKQNFIPPDVKQAVKDQMDSLLSGIKDAISQRKQDIADAMTQVMQAAVDALDQAEQQAIDNLQITVTMPDGSSFQYGGAAGTETPSQIALQQLQQQHEDQAAQDALAQAQDEVKQAQDQLAQDEAQLKKDEQASTSTTSEDYQAELAAVKPIIGQMGQAIAIGAAESGALGMGAGGLSEGEASFLYSELKGAAESSKSKTTTTGPDQATIQADEQRIAADKKAIEQAKKAVDEANYEIQVRQLQKQADAEAAAASQQYKTAQDEVKKKYEDEKKTLEGALTELTKWAETHKVTWNNLFGPKGELNTIFKKWHLNMNTLATQVGGDFLTNLAKALGVDPSQVKGASPGSGSGLPPGATPYGHFQTGGYNPKDGLAFIHGDEFVMRPEAVRLFGVPFLQWLNAADVKSMPPGLFTMPTPGGTMSTHGGVVVGGTGTSESLYRTGAGMGPMQISPIAFRAPGGGGPPGSQIALRAPGGGGTGPTGSFGPHPVILEIHSMDPQADWLTQQINFRMREGQPARLLSRQIARRSTRRQREGRF